ncbi:MAG: phosphatidylinositol mannoside acyltransferase [Actinobacteria bacterium]|nr:phosphatidylinositol mannoside acyltransferase [Actinomycetota bacterium]
MAYWAYRGVRWMARTLPERAGRRVFDTLAALGYRSLPRMRAIVRANQAQVLGLPEHDARVEASTREAFLLYARYWRESFMVPRLSDEEFSSRFECEGFEHIETALKQGGGVIAALPHLGNWDAAGRWMKLRGLPPVSVAEELRPPELFELFAEHRRELGAEVIGLSTDGKTGRVLAVALRSNRVVALVADRDFGGRGVEVEMFGGKRRMPAGPSLLSISTGAPLVPAAVYTTDRGWRCVMSAPIRVEPSGDRKLDVAALTQLLANSFERAISAAPADWHMFQPGWDP